MSRDIPESDWRHFKQAHQVLLERFCQCVLDELAAVAHAKEASRPSSA